MKFKSFLVVLLIILVSIVSLSNSQLSTSGQTSLTSGSQTSTTGSPTSTSGPQISTSGLQTSTTGSQTSTTGSPTSTTGSQTSTTGSPTSTSGSQTSTTGSQTSSSSTGSPTSTSGTQTSTTGSPTLTTGSQTSTSSSTPTPSAPPTNGCGITNESKIYSGPVVKEKITIMECQYSSGSTTCSDIARNKELSKGQIVYNNNGDSFKYVGDSTICYSIKYRDVGCRGIDKYTCHNYCQKFFVHNSTQTKVDFLSEYDYTFCQSLWTRYYLFNVNFSNDDSDPSNSIELAPTIITLFLITLLSLSILI